jgi:hypothetical protein
LIDRKGVAIHFFSHHQPPFANHTKYVSTKIIGDIEPIIFENGYKVMFVSNEDLIELLEPNETVWLSICSKYQWTITGCFIEFEGKQVFTDGNKLYMYHSFGGANGASYTYFMGRWLMTSFYVAVE